MYKTIPRSSIIGFLIGVLPGAGATIASFLAYGMERNFVSNEEKEKLTSIFFDLFLLLSEHGLYSLLLYVILHYKHVCLPSFYYPRNLLICNIMFSTLST